MTILLAEKDPDNNGIYIGRGDNIRMGSCVVDGAISMHGEPAVAQAAHITDAVVAHSIVDAGADLAAALETELEGFYDALGVKINAILVALENVGITAKT